MWTKLLLQATRGKKRRKELTKINSELAAAIVSSTVRENRTPGCSLLLISFHNSWTCPSLCPTFHKRCCSSRQLVFADADVRLELLMEEMLKVDANCPEAPVMLYNGTPASCLHGQDRGPACCSAWMDQVTVLQSSCQSPEQTALA